MTDAALSPAPLFQFALLDALLAGAYESGITAGELQDRGDFGIGCCEGLGGEVVFVDGQLFECTVAGPPMPMAPHEVLPFAQSCRFPEVAASPVEAADFDDLTGAVLQRLISRNLFHAIRLDGAFSRVLVRATARQQRPYPPLADVVHHQVETELTAVRGTLVGFWTPAVYQGIGVAGLHLHFLSHDRAAGGHVLELSGAAGAFAVGALAGLDLRLPTDAGFLACALDHDHDAAIAGLERA